jgi:hypothetical protein
MLTRQEREQNVLSLYNQGRTIREIAKEIRMSFRDIGTVLKKEEKEKERQERQLKNNTTPNSDSTENGMALTTQAYKLFSQAKTPVDVAIELNLSEKQVTKFYREYWKLKGLYKLNLIHDEIKDDVVHFAKLYRLSKAAGKSAEHVVRLLNIANNDLPALEDKYKKLQENVDVLESKELDASIDLESLKSEIQDVKQVLDHCRLSYQKEVSKRLQLHRENTELDRLLTAFKNNNSEYLKIRFVAKQTVKSALSDKRQLLKLALFSLIGSWRVNPTKFNFLIHGVSTVSAISKSSVMNHLGTPFSSHYNQKSYTENLIEIIVNEAASLYEKMVEDFADQTMTNAAASTDSNLILSMTPLDEQTHRYI